MNSTAALPDALREALGQVIANERREWRRERELIEAQGRETIAQLRAEIVELRTSLEAAVRDRLQAVRDGKDGADGEPGRDGVDGEDGEPGARGADGERGPAGENGKDGVAGKDGSDGRDGVDGRNGEDGEPGRDGLDGRDGVDGQNGRDGIDGKDGEAGPAGNDGRDGVDGKDGEPGERGPEGPPGKLPLVKDWSERVHYEGEAVFHEGSTWQALRDTGRSPPHGDWRCIARGGLNGADGRTFRIRGTWSAVEAYQALDVVALNGASFAAKRDEPGACPGDGWQLIAAQGKRGKEGEPGKRGERGPAGPSPVSLDVDQEGLLALTNADGSVVTCDLYPLLTRLIR